MPLQKRVSDLPAVPQVAATDLLIVSSSNATKRCTVQQIGAFFQANGVAGPPGPQGPSGASNWSEIAGKPSTFPPSAHTHSLSEVVGLTSALDGKQASGSYATLVGGKVPESQLPPIVTTWEGLTGKPSTFPPSTHSHVISDVTGLQSALDGKQASGSYAASVHSHVIADVTGLQSALDAKATPSDVTSAVAAVVGAAPASLNTLQELAAALSDDASFATTVTNALAGKAATVHTHVIADVTGLQTALDGKAASTHSHAIADVTGLQTALDGKQASGSYAAATHGHAIGDVTGLQTALDGKAALSHAHPATAISDSTTAGRALLTAADAAAQRTSLGLGSLATASSVAYGSLTGTPSTFAPSAHASSHASGGADALSLAASQITSGVIATARLGTGTADATTFLRGDGAFATPSASVTYATTAQAQDLTATNVAMNPDGVRTAIRSFVRVPYPGSGFTANGGSVSSLNNFFNGSLNGGASANGTAVAYVSSNSFSSRVRQGYDFSRPAAFNVLVSRQTCPATGIARFLFGAMSAPFAWTNLDLRGFGFEIRQSRIWVITHNGSTLASVDSGIDTFTGDFTSEIVDIWIRSDGAGNVTLTRTINAGSPSSFTTTGGPSAAQTGTAATAWAGVNNGATASAANFFFSPHLVSVQ